MKFGSKSPKKQRNFARNLGLHHRKRLCVCHLSKELHKELSKRAITVRAGDKVLIMRGGQKKKDGKVMRVDYKHGRVFVEKIVRKKSDGKEIMLPIRASNVMITELERADEARFGGKIKSKKPAQETGKAKPLGKEKEDIWAVETAKPAEKKEKKETLEKEKVGKKVK